MGGDLDGCYFPSLDAGSRTLVLMGRTGNGKSATGNSILGHPAFESRSSMSSVTTTTACLTTKFANGESVRVIDTPGLFDSHVGPEFISKEIVNCLNLAKDGIHAILLVLSVRVRFSKEEASVIKSLQSVFCSKLTDYMIVVFTGGDSLGKDQSLTGFLSQGCPDPLKEILHLCKNRMVLFDNATNDQRKKASQLQRLLSLVDQVVEANGGLPYTNRLISEMRKHDEQQKEELNAVNGRTEEQQAELMLKLQKSCDDQLRRMTEMAESKLMEANEKFQQQLAKEKAARLRDAKIAEDAKKQSDEIYKLKELLAKKNYELRAQKMKYEYSSSCAIL